MVERERWDALELSKLTSTQLITLARRHPSDADLMEIIQRVIRSQARHRKRSVELDEFVTKRLTVLTAKSAAKPAQSFPRDDTVEQALKTAAPVQGSTSFQWYFYLFGGAAALAIGIALGFARNLFLSR